MQQYMWRSVTVRSKYLALMQTVTFATRTQKWFNTFVISATTTDHKRSFPSLATTQLTSYDRPTTWALRKSVVISFVYSANVNHSILRYNAWVLLHIQIQPQGTVVNRRNAGNVRPGYHACYNDTTGYVTVTWVSFPLSISGKLRKQMCLVY